MEVLFCPEDGCSSRLIELIDGAKESIRLAIYTLTHDEIAEALIRAHERGIDVKIVMEREKVDRYSEYGRLKSAGIDVRLDSNPYLMHNKFMVIDSEVVATGSYNYTYSADRRNDENILILRSKEIAAAYEDEFNEIWATSSP